MDADVLRLAPRLALASLPLFVVAACAGSPGSPANDDGPGPSSETSGEFGPPWPAARDVTIVAETSGGIAGMDWQVTLDGDAGEIRLDHCSGCPWLDPEPRRLDDSEIRAIARAFVEAGIRKAPEQDFGTCEGCADQFFHEIVFTDATGTYRVVGDGPSLPRAFEDALNRMIWQEDPTER